ncbi:hypothetical protein SCOR_20745 [Sulfidibacter corallicola]|uniref:Uncharacterized protein n=1 Tax=Sulfidibacter corallicola TaxID=2818388 RepID=A0A8A4TUH8_SULCO|nr:hypothetical protein [Sulfidibacter corallicola]QTD53133.1 hypothetical protein J3U87_11785 [Sulfidibacter corallicola]
MKVTCNDSMAGAKWLLALLVLCSGLLVAGEQGQADEKSAELAKKVMVAMGGHENYDKTRFLTWNFFGSRTHYWDKWTGRARIEDHKEGFLVLMNIHDKKGKVWQNGEPVTDEKLVADKLQWGYEVWINDSYWLVMPYKLRDPGVTLSYAREDTMENGRPAHVLTMTFDSVGVTPENKYEVFIDKENSLVRQWAFFSKADDENPRFTTPWEGWQDYGKIKLCGDRGKAQLTNIAVFDTLPDTVFQDPAAVSTSQL